MSQPVSVAEKSLALLRFDYGVRGFAIIVEGLRPLTRYMMAKRTKTSDETHNRTSGTDTAAEMPKKDRGTGSLPGTWCS